MGQAHADEAALRAASLGGDHLAMAAYADWLEEQGRDGKFWRWAAESKLAPLPVKDKDLLKKNCNFLWCMRLYKPFHSDWAGPGSIPEPLWKFVSRLSTSSHASVFEAFFHLEMAYELGGPKSLEL